METQKPCLTEDPHRNPADIHTPAIEPVNRVNYQPPDDSMVTFAAPFALRYNANCTHHTIAGRIRQGVIGGAIQAPTGRHSTAPGKSVPQDGRRPGPRLPALNRRHPKATRLVAPCQAAVCVWR